MSGSDFFAAQAGCRFTVEAAVLATGDEFGGNLTLSIRCPSRDQKLLRKTLEVAHPGDAEPHTILAWSDEVSGVELVYHSEALAEAALTGEAGMVELWQGGQSLGHLAYRVDGQ